MNNVIKVHLPNGEVYKSVNFSDEHISKIRNLFGKENIEIELELSEGESLRGVKRRSLVLWGNVLANSYITIERS